MVDPAVLITGIISGASLLIALVFRLMPAKKSTVYGMTCPLKDNPEIREAAQGLLKASNEQLGLTKEMRDDIRDLHSDFKLMTILLERVESELERYRG